MSKRIGINEVILGTRSSGTRQRDLNLIPALLRQIQQAGWESTVYVARGLQQEMIGRLTGHRAFSQVVRTPLPTVPTYQRILKGIVYWEKRLRKDRIDLFHTAYYPVPRLSVPVLLIVNDLRFIHMPDTYGLARRYFLEWAVPRSLRQATRLLTISEDTKKDLVEHFGIEAERVDVIYLAADPAFHRVTCSETLHDVRRRYQLPDRFILAVGNLEPRKNLLRLIQAFTALRSAKAVEHDLVILGKPTLKFQSILEAAQASPFFDSIRFTGYVVDEDMASIYSLADVLSFPSLHEGFGVPILEAMACEIPVVTSNVSAMPEVAGDAAVLVDPWDVDSIASGIQKALTNSRLRSDLVEKGRQRLKFFSPEAVAQRTCDAYSRVVCNR